MSELMTHRPRWWRSGLELSKVLESQPRQTLVVKTGSDSSTAKRSAKGVSVLTSLLKPRAIAHVSNEAHSSFALGFEY